MNLYNINPIFCDVFHFRLFSWGTLAFGLDYLRFFFFPMGDVFQFLCSFQRVLSYFSPLGWITMLYFFFPDAVEDVRKNFYSYDTETSLPFQFHGISRTKLAFPFTT